MITDQEWLCRINTAYAWLCRVGERQVTGEVVVTNTRNYIAQRLGCAAGVATSIIHVLKGMGLLEEHKHKHRLVVGRTLTKQAILKAVAAYREQIRKQAAKQKK